MAKRNTDIVVAERLEFRVGIHQGDIVVEDGDIFGDGVNIAARLEGVADPGGICVSARVQEDAAGRLDLTFDDLGDQNLKNIARAVRVYRISSQQSQPRAGVSITAALTLPDKPSVAVLPFANMSADPEQEFFADGIAEDIITALSRFPSLFVIARNSCFAYKGRSVDVKQIGRELGVRYVLEGSLRKSGNCIRVTGQLVEAETGNHVWAERYDRDLADIFAVQDEITEAVTVAIAPAIADAEQQRAMRKPPDNLDAWSAYQRGIWHLNRCSAEDNVVAGRLFQQAIEADPNFSGGHKGLAHVQTQAAVDLQITSLPSILGSVEMLARRAVALDGGDAEAHSSLSNVLRVRGDSTGALSEADRAIAISPNFAGAHVMRGVALVGLGRPREGLTSLQTSARLDPRAVFASRANYITVSLYFLCEYEASIEAAVEAIRSYPDYPHPYRWLAAAFGQLGRIEEAREALKKAIAVAPGSFDIYVRNRVPWMRPEDYALMLDGLRKAGWEAWCKTARPYLLDLYRA